MEVVGGCKGVSGMKRGIVIGKFMPLHSGHIALIRFAAAHCDELIVVVASGPGDPIPGEIRLEWVKEEFKRYVRIKPHRLDDPIFSLPMESQLEQWVAMIESRYPGIDLIFSSEPFGQVLARHLRTAHISFDTDQNEHPVSATQIREHPFRYWDFIAPPARSYFVKRICFYGPESTGKSTMARKMAERYRTEFVPEVAREMITSNQFTLEDILRIGEVQTARILRKTSTANRLLFCDSDLITTQIYSEVYLKTIPNDLVELEAKVRIDYYFLFDIDVPWVSDGLRDLGERRAEMLEVFRSKLEQRGIRCTLISGTYEEREKLLIAHVDAILANG